MFDKDRLRDVAMFLVIINFLKLPSHIFMKNWLQNVLDKKLEPSFSSNMLS